MTQTEALRIAATMLRSIMHGGSYRAAEYIVNLSEIEDALKAAQDPCEILGDTYLQD